MQKVGICDPNFQGVIEDYFDVNHFYSDCSETDSESEEELDLTPAVYLPCLSTWNWAHG